jgi:hypothetical protein
LDVVLVVIGEENQTLLLDEDAVDEEVE